MAEPTAAKSQPPLPKKRAIQRCPNCDIRCDVSCFVAGALARSRSAKLLAIRQVTQRNAGRNTPGIDGVVCRTPEDRVTLLESGLDLTGYQPKPFRRVYIPKANGKLRPLGIPTVKDRVMQAVVKLALEPEWETRFEANSYGFRPGRCTMDAIVALHATLAPAGASGWLLDADISGCFENIGHDPLLARLPVFTTAIRRWLKAGTVNLGTWTPTEAGAPQGSPLSPVLANIALDGMERLFGAEDDQGRYVRPSGRRGPDHGVSLIRYADDWILLVRGDRAHAEALREEAAAVLAPMGLRLSTEKTKITHIDEGLDFLGWRIQRHRKRGTGKRYVYTYPAKKSLLAITARVKMICRMSRNKPSAALIHQLNPVLRGWCVHFRAGVSSRTFAYLRKVVWRQVMHWLRRKHGNGLLAAWKDIRRRYCDGGWWPHDGEVKLYNPGRVHTTRYSYRGTKIPSPWPDAA